LLPDINHFAYRIRREVKALNADMARLASNELVELVVDEDGRERWLVSNFNKRQERIPAKERMRSYRERKRQDEMESNATDTQSLRDSYDTVTGRNTDKIEIREDKDERERHAPAYDGHEENQETHQKILTVSSKIAGQVSDVYPGLKDDDFHKVAHSIILMGDRAIERIDDFGDWWTVNTFYKDDSPPTLKTFASKYKPFLAGVQSKDKANFKNQASGYHVSGSI
jgi:hypothetical protein